MIRVLSIVSYLICAGPLLAQTNGDVERGETIYGKCISCHQIGEGAQDRVGPHLNHIFDRAAGTSDAFRYSRGFQRAADDGLTWSYGSLDAFIEDPRALVAQTRMSFRGIEDAQDRADLIAYLRAFSDNPGDIPESAPTAQVVDHAVAPEILAIIGDPAYGEYLSGECTSCHQIDATSDGIPSITDWPTEDFVTVMHAFKNGTRADPVMQMMASRLSNDEIAALAAYFKDVE